MIFLHDPPLIFLKPRKVAGTSFEIALSHFAGPQDIITPIGKKEERLRAAADARGAQNYGFTREDAVPVAAWERAQRRREVPSKFYNHMTASEARQLLGEEIWDNARRISIIRNPFDLAVSLYYWRGSSGRDLPEFGEWCIANIPLLAQNRESYTIDGARIADHLLRYEHIAEDIAALETAIPALTGLGDIFGKTSAKSGVRPQSATAAASFAPFPQAAAAIATAFAEEIAQYGYRLEG